jgi:F-type H+-transporting ATPase subunit gamma
MRLIAMSSHNRLKQKQESLRNYCNQIDRLLSRIRVYAPNWQSNLLQPTSTTNHSLVILVSSQKGLCGNFNSILFDFFRKNNNLNNPAHIITIGKKAGDFVSNRLGIQPIIAIGELNKVNYLTIGNQIIAHIKKMVHPYSRVTLYSNYAKGFFTQLPLATVLIPFEEKSLSVNQKEPELIFEEPVDEILQELSERYVTARLQYVLFESLLAEQAARFISMDSSTRNANTILEATRIQYNKLRQAKITRELIELTGSLT